MDKYNKDYELPLVRIIEHLAHDLRTPLTTISLAGGAIKNTLPEMNNLSQKKLDRLTMSCDSIGLASKIANHTLNMLQTQVTELPSNDHFILTSITHCINEALADYPFTPNEAKLIHWHNTDSFNVRADPVLLKHVFFNLIKNAIYAIRSVGKGAIHISTESAADSHQVIVRDTGSGIAADILPHIFERFYSTYETKNGLGLAFCQQVMEVHGGTIACTSVIDEYTQFVLGFSGG